MTSNRICRDPPRPRRRHRLIADHEHSQVPKIVRRNFLIRMRTSDSPPLTSKGTCTHRGESYNKSATDDNILSMLRAGTVILTLWTRFKLVLSLGVLSCFLCSERIRPPCSRFMATLSESDFGREGGRHGLLPYLRLGRRGTCFSEEL